MAKGTIGLSVCCREEMKFQFVVEPQPPRWWLAHARLTNENRVNKASEANPESKGPNENEALQRRKYAYLIERLLLPYSKEERETERWFP